MRLSHINHARKKSPRIVKIPLLHDALHVPFRTPTERDKSFGLSSHEQVAIDLRPEQWLDPVPVASRKEKLFARIVKAESKFATQMLQEASAVLLVQSKDNLAVTSTLELRTGLFGKLLPDVVGTVKLAVHDRVDVAIGGVKWLLAIRAQIVNGEADVPKSWTVL